MAVGEPHEVGGDACGPNTLNVTVPVGEAPRDKDADSDVSGIAVPAAPDDGAAIEPNEGEAGPTIVSVIPAPQVEAAG